MNLNKAIRKQNKSYKRFIASMSLVFFVLPFVLYITRRFHVFFISYLMVIEVLIIVAVFIRISSEKLQFGISGYKLKIKQGLMEGTLSLPYDKVALVHAEGSDEKLQVIILCTSKFRNKLVREVNSDFLQRHSYVAYHYYQIKKLQPENNYYYFIVNKGGYLKYDLLCLIFKNCVHAFFTDKAIEKIKQVKN